MAVEQNNNQQPVRKKILSKPMRMLQDFQIPPYVWVVLTTLIGGFLAGAMMAVSGTVYLSTDSKYLGAALATVGFAVIFTYGFSLYTAKVGYAMEQDRLQNLMLIPIWVGNLLGCLTVGGLLRLTRLSEKLISRAEELCSPKLADGSLSILLLSIFCGLLLFIASDRFKNGINAAQKYLPLFLSVMVLMLCGFEHSVANVFFFTVAGAWSFRAVWYLLIMTLGNSIGALLIPLFHKAVKVIRAQYKSE